KKINPVLLGLVCLSLCLLDLEILFSPYWSRDLRLFYATGPLLENPGSNLNTGLWQGWRLLRGQGLTIATGQPPWERMPGYGLFCALGGVVFGRTTMVDLAAGVVLLQVLLYCVALGFFAWAAGQLWRPQVVWALGVLIALLPKQVGNTQVDS